MNQSTNTRPGRWIRSLRRPCVINKRWPAAAHPHFIQSSSVITCASLGKTSLIKVTVHPRARIRLQGHGPKLLSLRDSGGVPGRGHGRAGLGKHRLVDRLSDGQALRAAISEGGGGWGVHPSAVCQDRPKQHHLTAADKPGAPKAPSVWLRTAANLETAAVDWRIHSGDRGCRVEPCRRLPRAGKPSVRWTQSVIAR